MEQASPAMTEQAMADAENLHLRAALAYARRGWHVFPCHTPVAGGCSCNHKDCQDVGKHPRTMHGLKDASADEGQIRKWWGMWPDANVGIACGPSGLHVLDIDPRHGGDESLGDLRAKHGNEWLDTAIVQTGGGGTHYFYEAATPRLRNRAGVQPGIDIRGDGGYVVAPPSLHASGGRYAWEVTVNEKALAPWPTDILGGAAQEKELDSNPGGPIAAGRRNDTLTSFAGLMRRMGMSAEAIYQALRIVNAEQCEPPMSDGEVRKIANSVSRYAPASDVLLDVKGGGPLYSALRKHAVDPPIWILRVGETDVRVSTDELSSHRALRKAALAQADLVLPRMKDPEWDNELAALMASLAVIEAPSDASEAGLAWSCIVEFLSRRTEEEERFGQGRPVERDGFAYATGKMIKDAVRQAGLLIDQRYLWVAIRTHGGDAGSVRIAGKVCRAWHVPVEELS